MVATTVSTNYNHYNSENDMQTERGIPMKCYRCGYEVEEGIEYCPFCTAPVTPTSATANKVLSILKDKLFLAICVLLSVSVGAAFLQSGSPSVVTLLAMIFLWINYAKGRKNVVHANYMRLVSGVVYAEYVLTNVAAIILAVCGILLGFLIPLFSSDPKTLAAMTQGFNTAFYASGLTLPFELTDADIIGIFWILAALFVLMGAIELVLNIFARRKIHRFVKSLYKSVEDGGITPIINAGVAKVWLWVFGITQGLTALSNLLTFDFLISLSSACSAAAYIVGAVLVNKYFVENHPAEAM